MSMSEDKMHEPSRSETPAPLTVTGVLEAAAQKQAEESHRAAMDLTRESTEVELARLKKEHEALKEKLAALEKQRRAFTTAEDAMACIDGNLRKAYEAGCFLVAVFRMDGKSIKLDRVTWQFPTERLADVSHLLEVDIKKEPQKQPRWVQASPLPRAELQPSIPASASLDDKVTDSM